MVVFTTIEWVILGCVAFLFVTISAIVAFIIAYNYKWNFKYIVFENVAGSGWVPTRKGKCRLVSIGDSGEEIFYLQRIKKWRIAYGKRIGKRYISWAVGGDGYWYNNDFKDLDVKLKKLGINPVDKDMRMAYAAARDLMKNRYEQKSFMDKYGTIITFGMLFLCILAMIGFMWFNTNQSAKISSANVEAAKTMKEVMQESLKVTQALDVVQSGGTGYVPAPTP